MQINLHISKNLRIFAANLENCVYMMQLVNNNGTVLLEREKPRAMRANTLTLRAKRLSHGIKKTVRPVLMSMDVIVFGDFVLTNADNKTTFQFRTPSTGGVEL